MNERVKNNKLHTVFLIAGRTGGPIVPLIAITKNLDCTPIILGVKNGVEVKIAKDNNYKIEYLPEAKFTLLSFKKANISERFKGLAEFFQMIFKLLVSFLKCCYLLLKYKPRAVLSGGSFLAVPMIYATIFLRIFGLKTKIITHQQDPLPGLANKLTFKFSDLKTCVFNSSKKYTSISDAKVIPNPINTKLFDDEYVDSVFHDLIKKDPELHNFFTGNKKVLLVMGGGSGSEFLNNWVWDNIDALTDKFKVIHLTGVLQVNNNKNFKNNKSKLNTSYIARDFLSKEYPAILKKSDIVLARPGLGTITELKYLHKPAVLVPIPYSHQEKNSDEVKDLFTILNQSDGDLDWLNIIEKTYSKGWVGGDQDIKKDLNNYYAMIRNLLS